MDIATRRLLLHKYIAGPQVIVDTLNRIGAAALDRKPSPKDWSPREIVHHLADSEMTSAIRLRRLLAEDHPLIVGYNEEEFARRLYYDRPVQASLEAIKAARATSAEILARIPEADWLREGAHSESGPYTVETWLEIYAAHCHDHADKMLQVAPTGR